MEKIHSVNLNDGLDSLWKIANFYGFSLSELKSSNPEVVKRFRPDDRRYCWIFPGDTIKLPADKSLPRAENTIIPPQVLKEQASINSQNKDLPNYSHELSTDNVCQLCPEGRQKVIFLTFDDGPEPGTVEIYEALKAKNIPATFFFVGENVLANETGVFKKLFPNSGLEPGLFRRIYEDKLFQIGNHSQTQAHQFYDSYYETGLRINSDTKKPSADLNIKESRRSVLVDFELAGMAFSYTLIGSPEYYNDEMQKIENHGYREKNVGSYFLEQGVKPYFPFNLARLPGTDLWRIDGKGPSLNDLIQMERGESANDLEQNGYQVFGWDTEWELKDKKSTMSTEVRAEHKDLKDGWWDGYYSQPEADRLNFDSTEMFERVSDKLDKFTDKTFFESNNDSQVVILLHDRQFRNHAGKSGKNEYIKELESFIDKCLEKEYQFDVLENYRS